MSKKIKIYGEFYNDTPGGFVASSDQIKDNTSGKSQKAINSELYQINAPKTKYLICNTGGDVAEKVIEFPGFVLDSNVRLIIQMANSNTAPNPTLNINNTGAKGINYIGGNTWAEDEIFDAYYDGEKYNLTSYTQIRNIIEYLGPDYITWLKIKNKIIPPNDEIWYTTTNGNKVNPMSTSGFGANLVSNTYENGKGILKFNGNINAIGGESFTDCENLSSITIPDSVTSIEYEAFVDCSNLISIDIQDTITNIGSSAFSGTGLTSLHLPSSLTSIQRSTFSGCTGLTSITIPGTITSIGESAFSGTGLTSLYIPASVTTIGTNAFHFCKNLASIIVDENNSVFDSRDNCNAIIKTSDNEIIVGSINITIPSTVTSIHSEVFAWSESLKHITIPSSITSIGDNAFTDSGLETITIEEGFTAINGYSVFSLCEGLTSITLPSTLTNAGDGTFYGCTNLTSITSLNTTPPTIGNDTFYNVPGDCLILVPGSSVDTYKTASGWSTRAAYIQAIQ